MHLAKYVFQNSCPLENTKLRSVQSVPGYSLKTIDFITSIPQYQLSLWVSNLDVTRNKHSEVFIRAGRYEKERPGGRHGREGEARAEECHTLVAQRVSCPTKDIAERALPSCLPLSAASSTTQQEEHLEPSGVSPSPGPA